MSAVPAVRPRISLFTRRGRGAYKVEWDGVTVAVVPGRIVTAEKWARAYAVALAEGLTHTQAGRIASITIERTSPNTRSTK